MRLIDHHVTGQDHELRLPQLVQPFPPSVFAARRESLRGVMEKKKIDAFLFSGISDLAYLTGFHSEGYYVLVSQKGCWLFCSDLLASQAREAVCGVTFVVGRRLTRSILALKTKRGWRSLAFDPEQVTFRLGSVLAKAGFRPQSSPLEELRIVKDAQELDRLAKACHITAEGVRAVIRQLRVGQSEKQMAVALENYFYRSGADGVGFELIAATGPHTALPHHRPTSRRLQKNEPVLLDVGCQVGGYRSDLTRTVYYGTMTASFKRVYRIVQEAQDAGKARVKPGSTGGRVDAATRGVIRQAGFGRQFVHSTGHGVGLDIHEPPWNRPKSPDVFRSGMVLTVEPGIYLPGRFGVRIEDTLRVTDDGHEVLTR